MNKKERKPLIRELTLTVLSLSAAMIFMWFLFYAVINRIIMRQVTRSMEHVSRQIISEMEKSFLNSRCPLTFFHKYQLWRIDFIQLKVV